MLTDWTGSITPLTLSDEELDLVDSFTYLGSCTNASGNITNEITSKISSHIFIDETCHVYNCTVRLTLIYACETWSIRSEDLHQL